MVEYKRVHLAKMLMGLTEAIPSAGYGTQTLAAAGTEVIVKFEISGGKGYLGAIYSKQVGNAVNEAAHNLEFAKKVDGGSWVDFFNPYGLYGQDLDTNRQYADGAVTTTGVNIGLQAFPQLCTLYRVHGVGTKTKICGVHSPMASGYLASKFESTLEIRAENKEASFSIDICGFYVVILHEEQATLTTTINP